MEFQKVWQERVKKWRANIAIMKTRGFWTVNVVWFAAGFWFFRLLPGRQAGMDGTSYVLNTLLIAAIILPIYWSAVLDGSRQIDKMIEKRNRRKSGQNNS